MVINHCPSVPKLVAEIKHISSAHQLDFSSIQIYPTNKNCTITHLNDFLNAMDTLFNKDTLLNKEHIKTYNLRSRGLGSGFGKATATPD